MDSLYFTAMIIGIAWLAIWTAMPEGLPFASPFDVQPDGAASPKAEPEPVAKRPVASRGSDAAPRPASARTNAAATWRKRIHPRRVETAAAEASSGPPERRPIASWRTRRELPAGSRRRH